MAGTLAVIRLLGMFASFDRADRLQPDIDEFDRLLLCDAQTSGGLLIAVAEEKVERLQKALLEHGCKFAAVVGQVEGGTPGRIRVV